MNCPACGRENPDGAKYCNQCAGALPLRCLKCGASNPAESRFCNSCAAPLTAGSTTLSARTNEPEIQVNPEQVDPSSAPDGERKTITALFADIKGSMELMEDLDPEEARAIVDPAIKLMIDAVHRYDGYVVQSTGDGIFALFGAPLAHEDHPQRALYAALRLQEELKRYSDRMRQEGRLPLQARVGVNTGELLADLVSVEMPTASFVTVTLRAINAQGSELMVHRKGSGPAPGPPRQVQFNTSCGDWPLGFLTKRLNRLVGREDQQFDFRWGPGSKTRCQMELLADGLVIVVVPLCFTSGSTAKANRCDSGRITVQC